MNALTLPTIENPSSNLETQTASIQFLLMENSRLRSNEYARAAFELFHPSDPLMKRQTRKESGEDADIVAAKKQRLSDYNFTQTSVLELGREVEQFLAKSQVVDLTNLHRKEKDQVGQALLSPENQWKVQHLYLARLLSRCNKFQDEAPINSTIAAKQGTTGVGKVSFYK